MPTARAGYFLKDGTKVPSVTTIGGRFKDSRALMIWANKEGLEGRNTRQKADEAAAIGSVVHTMVENHVKYGDTAPVTPSSFHDLDSEGQAKAMSAFHAYRRWEENFKVRMIATEIELVSERHRYGGCPDAIGWVGNQLCLIDWKTSSGVYPEMLVQLAAYRELWNENNPEMLINGPSHLLRFSKEHGDFAHHSFEDLSEAWSLFMLYRRAFDIDKTLKKRAT